MEVRVAAIVIAIGQIVRLLALGGLMFRLGLRDPLRTGSQLRFNF
jgi:hypothetical protein